MSLFHSLIYEPTLNKALRNINYALSPILPKKVKLHPSGKISFRLDNGEKMFLKTNQTSFLTRELFYKGAKNFEYFKIFTQLVKDINVFLDIGSNIGYYSILAAKLNKNLTVCSFEPSEGPLKYQLENIKINKVAKQVTLENLALSNAEGEVDFYNLVNDKFPRIYNLSGEHNLGAKKHRKSKISRVSAMTLDSYIEEKNITKIDLIKIDTEGAEHLILSGSTRVLQDLRPIIICETLFGTNEAQIEAIALKNNYNLYNFVEPNKLNLVKTIQRKEDNGVRNCFLVPNEKSRVIERFI